MKRVSSQFSDRDNRIIIKSSLRTLNLQRQLPARTRDTDGDDDDLGDVLRVRSRKQNNFSFSNPGERNVQLTYTKQSAKPSFSASSTDV